MRKCYHCGRETPDLYYCEQCGQNYCQLHKEPIDHECNLKQEEFQGGMSQPTTYREEANISTTRNTQAAPWSPAEQGSPSHEAAVTSSSEEGKRTDGSFIWYRQARNIPDNAFSEESGIEFKGILLPYKSELLHFIIGAILIYSIGLLGFYNPTNQAQLQEMGYGWIIFLIAGIYTTAFLFHELGHRQTAIHFGLQSKFRLLKYGMMITVMGLIMGIISLITSSRALPAFALPGAVVVLGLDTINRKTGLCKAAGPTVNLLYGTILLGLSFLIRIYPINYFISISASINFMLGAFNLIPVGILDGQAILKWNKAVYFLLAILMVLLLVGNYVLIYLPQNINPYYQMI
jgi:Zn-dependent protease